MNFPFRAISFFASACIMAAMLIMSGGPAAAGGNVPAFGDNTARASSWAAGGHFGYNWQQGSVVYGFETDLQGTHLDSQMTGGLTHGSESSTDFARTSATINAWGTFRGRVGFTTGQWLFFVTGGAAYANVNLNSAFATQAPFTMFDTTQTRLGGVAGAGFEYMFAPNWMLNFNYQYVDLGHLSDTSFAASRGTAIVQTANVHAQFQAAMIGFSYRFAPASGSPWGGGYGGGQVGGAWGDRTNAIYNGFSVR